MLRYLTHRLLQGIVVLTAMSFVIYALIGLMPGDPIDLMISANPQLTPGDAERLRRIHGLDRPIVERYLAWAGAALGGDFGYSRAYARPVLDVLGGRLLNTAALMIGAFVLALSIGLPAGILAATRPGGALDGAINLVCFVLIAVPTFWLALMLIILFAVVLGWLPAGGIGTPGGGGLFDTARHLILPVLTLAMVESAAYARYARAAMIEAMRQDWIRTARAKGAGPVRVVLGHALRNAMIPVTTIMALGFGALFSGALITETMFAYPGMGKLIYDAVMGNDFNLALVALLFATLLTLIANLGADLIYAALDPRISYAAPERGARGRRA
ncbi:MAG TPA: ABC transporter permease [Alphaproteobacteria bacterium]|nr:ABC transporter permease [Alphaproteobacteria bacterium]